MPNARTANAVRLEFAPDSLVQSNLSGAVFTGDWLWVAANREPVRFASALTESVPLPHGRGTNRAEAICDLPPALSGGKARWLVLYDAPGADRKGGKHTVFGDLLRLD